ncbi:MAG: HIRAN domain-containing protein [Pseudomonadota bacterium]
MGWLSRLLGLEPETAPPAGKSYTIGIVGESKKNIDGSSRQTIIKRCHEGQRVRLVAEPDNPYDGAAIFVCTERGEGLGYISRDHNEWIGKKLAKGQLLDSRIYAVIGGDKERRSVGVLLSLTFA